MSNALRAARVIDGRDLMRLHIETLFTLDVAGRLVASTEASGAPAPRFFFGRSADGDLCRVRHDTAPALAEELASLCAAAGGAAPHDDPIDAEPFIARLAADQPVLSTWAGPAFRFPGRLPSAPNTVRVRSANAAVLEPCLASWLDDVAQDVPMYAALVDGAAVALCASVRITRRAHEAGVETHPDFRGRGYAARAVAAWARSVRESHRVPLYSTAWTNTASRALARRLNLIQYGVDLHIT
jgi:RimJ/RimL family protein N-acetyltransferase